MKNIIVTILAAGDSGRFWPFEGKYNIDFAGRDLAYIQLNQLENNGFKNIIVVANDKNIEYFSRLKEDFPNLNISVLKQTNKNGMAGAILSIKDFISGKSLLVLNQSDLLEDSLFSNLKDLIYSDSDGIIAGTEVDSYYPGGYITLNGDTIKSITEKPDQAKVPSSIVKFVFDYFKDADSFIQSFEEVTTNSDDLYERGLDNLIKKGFKFKFVVYKGFWGYLKYPWHVLTIMDYFLGKIRGQKINKAIISDKATVSGDVYIADGVRILEGAKILGPCYLGRGTIIGNNSIVRESMIGDNCVVGYSTEVARSYIGENCWFHSNYIGDSVIMNNVGMGAGAVLANFKLSEDTVNSVIGNNKLNTERLKLGALIGSNVRIGVNSSIMPGIKIGKNSLIGAQVLLSSDLPDGKYISTGKIKYEIVNNKIEINTEKRDKILKRLKK